VPFNLEPLLAARWTGVRKSVSTEGGSMVFTGGFLPNQIGGPSGHTPRLALRAGREYLFEYRIRFNGDFDWSRGGKIPGLAGGTATTGCVATTGNGFSARMMWRDNGRFIAYTYDNNQSVECGNTVNTGATFEPARWYRIKERVRLNTGVNDDGILQVWLDDRMVVNRSNMSWMNEAPNNRINSVLFHSFYGGSTVDWSPGRETSISFADPTATLVAE
jgi:hypothetical protein